MSDAPAKSPCGSCPYRQDAPSGLWHEDHYELLPEYDKPTVEQPLRVFGCHQNDGKLCAGWVAVHDMEENFALRLALSAGDITSETFDACLDYETSVPLFSNGAEARDHGLRDIDNPSERTIRTARKIAKTVEGTWYG